MHPKLSSAAADGILVFHALLVIFAVCGGLMILMDYRFAVIHIPFVIWCSAVNLANWTCPLTPIEQKLRLNANQPSFEEGWIQHYLEPMVRPLGMPRKMELIAGVSIVAWNLLVYSILLLFYFFTN